MGEQDVRNKLLGICRDLDTFAGRNGPVGRVGAVLAPFMLGAGMALLACGGEVETTGDGGGGSGATTSSTATGTPTGWGGSTSDYGVGGVYGIGGWGGNGGNGAGAFPPPYGVGGDGPSGGSGGWGGAAPPYGY